MVNLQAFRTTPQQQDAKATRVTSLSFPATGKQYAPQQAVLPLQRKLVAQLAPDNNPQNAKRNYNPNGDNTASTVEGQVNSISDGGVPTVSPEGWNDVLAGAQKVKGSWVRFHLLNQWLGGKGNNTANLVPTTVGTNHNGTWKQLEQEAQQIASNNKWVWWYVTVNHHAASIQKQHGIGFPSSIRVQAQTWNTNKWENLKTNNGDYTLNVSEPDFSGATPERYFHEITGSQWVNLVGVNNISLINALVQNSSKIKTLSDLDEQVYFNEKYNFQNLNSNINKIDDAIKGKNKYIIILLEE